MPHTFRSTSRPRLSDRERANLTATFLWSRLQRLDYEKHILARLNEDAHLNFNGDIYESYAYELWDKGGNLLISRLPSGAVHRLVDKGLIDVGGDITDAGREALS